MKEILTDELLDFFGEQYQNLNIQDRTTFGDFVDYRLMFRTVQALWRNNTLKN